MEEVEAEVESKEEVEEGGFMTLEKKYELAKKEIIEGLKQNG